MKDLLKKVSWLDVLLVCGILLLALGAALIYGPAGVIVAGCGCIALYVLWSAAEAGGGKQ